MCVLRTARSLVLTILVSHVARSAALNTPSEKGHGMHTGPAWTPDKSWSPYEWLRAREPAHPALYHMHIPKVAGISFIRDALSFIPNGTGFYSGETCYSKYASRKTFDLKREGLHNDGIVTMLRNPREHVLSQFVECADDSWGKKIVPKDKRHLLKDFGTWVQHFTFNFTTDDLGCYHPFNMQTRAFLCESHLHHLTDEADLKQTTDLGRALQRMNSTFFVGLAEYYQESLCLLYEKVTSELPDWCNCEDIELWSKYVPQHESHKTRSHNIAELTSKELDMVDQLTELDRKLYIEAQRRFLRDVEAVEGKHHIRVMC